MRSREHALPERLPRSPFHTSDPGAAPLPDPAAVFEPQVTRCPRRVSPGVPQATKLGPERGVAPRLGTEAVWGRCDERRLHENTGRRPALCADSRLVLDTDLASISSPWFPTARHYENFTPNCLLCLETEHFNSLFPSQLEDFTPL